MSRSERRSKRILSGLKEQTPKVNNIAPDYVIPNYSGTKRDPQENQELATKKYVDDNIAAGGIAWNTPVNASIVPDTDLTYNVGSTTKRMNYLYTQYVTGNTNADRISFGSGGEVQLYTNNAERLAVSDSGVQLGNANAIVTTILDEDAMGTNSNTALATQQSIKAYSDAHSTDNTQAHTDYLINSAADVGVGLTLTGDNSSVDTTYVPMVLYNTDDTPPAANTVPRGTIYIQYTA